MGRLIHLSSKTQDPMMTPAREILGTVLRKVEKGELGELGESPRCMMISSSVSSQIGYSKIQQRRTP